MVERTADDEHQRRLKAHGTNQILCIGHDGIVAEHDSLGLPGGASGKENVGYLWRWSKRLVTPGNVAKAVVGQIVLQGHGHGSQRMECEVGDEEVGVLLGAHAHHLTSLHPLLVQLAGSLFHPLPQR